MSDSPLLLFFISAVFVIDLYLAQRPKTKRPEAFYAVAALMLFAALMAVKS